MNTRTAHKKHYILFFAMAMILLLGACSTPGSSQTTGQLLQNSLNAMKQLKAVHVDMKLATTLVGTSNTPSATSNAPRGITVNVSASGDEVMPDKTSIHLSLGQGIFNGYSLSEISVGKQIYIQNSKGQWYALNQSSLKGISGNPFAQMNAANYNNLLALAQKATYTDHGVQALNGQNLRHITVTFDKNALKDLLNASGQVDKLTAAQKQKLDAALNNIKLINPTLDLWIDEATSYVHRMELKFGLNINVSSLVSSVRSTSSTSSSTPSSISSNFDVVIDYSKFNESITISAPSNTIPTDNSISIFGFGG
jgi:hypothetical protein